MPATLLIETALATAERLINELLRRGAPDALHELAKLTGRSIEIEATDYPLHLYILFGRQGIQLLREDPGTTSTRLRGKLMALARLGHQGQGMPAEVTIEGDVDLAQTLQRLLEGLAIDWEEVIAHSCGDVIAHGVVERWRRAGQHISMARTNLREDLVDYLLEEARLLPYKDDIEAFIDDVDEFRAALDRSQARLKRLQQRFPGKDGRP